MWTYLPNEYEDPDCGCCEPTEEVDEDRLYDESREREAGWL